MFVLQHLSCPEKWQSNMLMLCLSCSICPVLKMNTQIVAEINSKYSSCWKVEITWCVPMSSQFDLIFFSPDTVEWRTPPGRSCTTLCPSSTSSWRILNTPFSAALSCPRTCQASRPSSSSSSSTCLGFVSFIFHMVSNFNRLKSLDAFSACWISLVFP